MCLCLNTVTLDRAIEFVTGIRPSRMLPYRSTFEEENMAPLQKLQSRCFGGQSPEATDVSTCESSFSLLHSPSCIRTTSPSPPPPLFRSSPPSHLSTLSLSPLTSIASSSSHGRAGTAQKPRVLPKVGFGLRPPPPPPTPLQASAGIWKYSSLSFFGRGILSQNVLIAKDKTLILAKYQLVSSPDIVLIFIKL